MVRITSDFLGKQLLDKGKITKEQLEQAIQRQKTTGKRMGETLVELGFTTEKDVVAALSSQLGIGFIDLETYDIDKKVLSFFSEEMARQYKFMPLFKIGDTITVAMEDPLNVGVVDKLRRTSNCKIEPLFATLSGIAAAITKYYTGGSVLTKTIREIEQAEKKEAATVDVVEKEFKLDHLMKEALKAPVVKLVDLMIKEAVEQNVSDIHLEPEEDTFYVRYRIDGVLYDITSPPKRMQLPIVSRIKIMANMDIAEKRLPQDGRIYLKIDGKEVDLRISSFPTIFGENIVLRILDKSRGLIGLGELGFSKKMLNQFEKLITLPNGIMLVTGPTGSGKTTTLYAILNKINDIKKNIITLEDPVEYQIDRVRQTQIDVKTGLTFPVGMRSIIRQDPDVIMIGEIRDLETAEIAIRSALTGHLVFSTLHTNDSGSAVTRLLDMGIEPFLVSSSVRGILAQRLVRRLCKQCKTKYEPTKADLKLLGLDPKKKYTFYKKVGCNKCNKVGYRGRMGIFEFLIMDEDIQEMVLAKASSTQIMQKAVSKGLATLKKAAIEKVLDGITSVEEVIRVTSGE